MVRTKFHCQLKFVLQLRSYVQSGRGLRSALKHCCNPVTSASSGKGPWLRRWHGWINIVWEAVRFRNDGCHHFASRAACNGTLSVLLVNQQAVIEVQRRVARQRQARKAQRSQPASQHSRIVELLLFHFGDGVTHRSWGAMHVPILLFLFCAFLFLFFFFFFFQILLQHAWDKPRQESPLTGTRGPATTARRCRGSCR